MFNTLTFPETMEEFIEQYKVVKGENLYCDGVEFIPVYRMKEWVKHLQPRKGKWTIKNGELAFWDVCSECGRMVIHKAPFYNFCPHCGADMRGEQDG